MSVKNTGLFYMFGENNYTPPGNLYIPSSNTTTTVRPNIPTGNYYNTSDAYYQHKVNINNAVLDK